MEEEASCWRSGGCFPDAAELEVVEMVGATFPAPNALPSVRSASACCRAPAASEVDVAGKIENLVSGLGPRAATDFRRLLSLFEWSPVLFDARPARFSTLSPDAQTEVLRGWVTSRLGFRRTGFIAIKRVAMSVYYAQEASWPAIEFPGPWLQS